MNSRERLINVLHFKEADRLPAVHFGYWQELLFEWADQGHISHALARSVGDGNDADRELDRIIGWDHNYFTTVGCNMGLCPGFEHKVLEVLHDGSQRVQTWCGVIERVKPGIVSIPSEDDYLLKDRDAFEKLFREKMRFFPERIDLEYFRSFNSTRRQDIPVGLAIGSVLGQIRDMTTVAGMSYLMYDEDEELFADIVNEYAEMQYQCTKAILETGAKFDFAHFWEDICFKNGPLLSPTVFDEICAEHYKKRTALCLEHGIDLVSLDCDGVISALLPTWVDNGVNVMFPLEVGVWGDQFEGARARFGERVLGVGGMDKTVFRRDRDAVDAELSRLAQLAKLGGFVPCPDHRLMPGSKFELVRYYAEEIKKIKI